MGRRIVSISGEQPFLLLLTRKLINICLISSLFLERDKGCSDCSYFFIPVSVGNLDSCPQTNGGANGTDENKSTGCTDGIDGTDQHITVTNVPKGKSIESMKGWQS